MLKKLCLLFVTVCVALSFSVVQFDVAFAEENLWVRIVDDDVKLYANADREKVMFLLQKSYYLQVLEQTDDMYRVAVMQNQQGFPQISGWVRQHDVEKCDQAPTPPLYPTEKISVSADSAQIKLAPSTVSATVLTVTHTQTMAYYGTIRQDGDVWYYVYFSGKFGYVSAETVDKPTIALHPTPLVAETFAPQTPQTPQDTTAPATQQSQKKGNGLEIALIVFVVLLAVAITLALFLPGNLKKKGDVFDKDI